MTWLIVQGLQVLLVAGTPLSVVAVIDRVAARELAAGRPPLPRRLLRATIVVWAIFAAWLALDARAVASHARDLALGLAQLSSFALLAGLAWSAMQRTVRQAQQQVRDERGPVAAAVRRASLERRRLTDHLGRALLWTPSALALSGAALVALRLLSSPAGERRLLLPVGFVAVAVTFLVLYAFWLRDEALAPAGPEGTARRGVRVRRIFALQLGLVAVFSALAVIVAGLDYGAAGARIVAAIAGLVGGAVGVFGCACAIASGVSRHSLESTDRVLLR